MPPGANEAGRIEFIFAQLELTRRYAAEIERGDYQTAQILGRQLDRGARELSMIMVNFDREVDIETMARISSALGEMKDIQERLLGWLEPTRDRIGELLSELHRGRTLIAGYRSGRTAGAKMLEMSA